ncbi:N-acyl homoserine lactonase family protein [Arenibaculum pallidiluteum]|uniref:N-acyl homoserine lactonase family protein n=1 Tax=Arenibaculum pallidiluteum TaxID=2812559 RepID=UPI001A9664A8|nr:N-acyl homoserine lactonase family protein [Arenibaculum pallidiluteum]
MIDDVYEVYALRYAHSDRRSPENFIGGDSHDVAMPLAYYVWVVRNAQRTFVVDTGFDQASADRRRRDLLRPVGEGLRTLGIDADTVQDVIITHMHYDHAGNDDLFPRARFHVQDCEMSYATGRCMCHGPLNHPYDVDNVVAMVRRVYSGRVTFHDGTDELAPGITLHRIGGHSRGLQSVRVRTRRGHVVLASDAAHFFAHLDRKKVFPTVDSVADVLEGYETVLRLATSRDHVVPGHDPAVLELYPAPSPSLQGWVARLDADPAGR